MPVHDFVWFIEDVFGTGDKASVGGDIHICRCYSTDAYFLNHCSRCLAGMLNGNTGVMKTMVSEITDPTNIAQAFGFLPVVWSIGGTIG